MARLLESKGIISGKAFIEGELYVDTSFGEVGWGYHVAPVVMVKVKGQSKPVPYVIDPSLFDKPVPYSDWKAKMTAKPKAKVSSEYFTNRFAYDPNDKNANLTDYQADTVEDMDSTNKNFTRMLTVYKAQKGIK